MTTVLPSAPPAPSAPSTLPAEPRPSPKGRGDDESFSRLLDQHAVQSPPKEAPVKLAATVVAEAGESETTISQKEDSETEEDPEEAEASLLAMQPHLPTRHAPTLLPLGEHLLFSPEMLNGLQGLGVTDPVSEPARDAEADPETAPKLQTDPAPETPVSSAPRMALLTALFPTTVAQLQAPWTPPESAPQPRGPKTLGTPAMAPLSASPQTATVLSTPGTPEGNTASIGSAVRVQIPAETVRLNGGWKEIVPGQTFATSPIATPRIPEQSTGGLVLPTEVAKVVATTLPTAGQNLPQGENSPLPTLGESSVASAAPRTTSEISTPVATAPATEVAASAVAPAVTLKVNEQTRAQNPRGTPAAKRGEVMPNSALQAAPALPRASSAAGIEAPLEARPAVKIASAPPAPTTFTDTPATAISSGPTTANPARDERHFERPQTPDGTRPEIEVTAPANGPAARPEFEHLRPELTSGPSSPREEATVSRTEMTRVIDRTTDAVVRMKAAGTERIEVAVQLESGAKLTIQLRLANGEVTPFIRTNSEALRTALEQNWSQFSDRSAERSVRLTPPVFEMSQSSTNMTDLSQQRQDRDSSHPDRQAEAFHFNARRPRVAPATASGPTRIATATDGLNLYA